MTNYISYPAGRQWVSIVAATAILAVTPAAELRAADDPYLKERVLQRLSSSESSAELPP